MNRRMLQVHHFHRILGHEIEWLLCHGLSRSCREQQILEVIQEVLDDESRLFRVSTIPACALQMNKLCSFRLRACLNFTF
jgi:hypothetical protein